MTLTLADFLDSEMKKRGMGVTEFAKFIKTTHSTISKYLDGKIETPGVDFLIKVSDATGVPLETILGIAFPDAAKRLPFSPKASLVASRFDNLPESIQNLILREIFAE